MKFVRNTLHEPGKEWRKTIDEINLMKITHANNVDKLQWLRDNLRQGAAQLQAAINTNHVLQQAIKNNRPENTVEIYIGELPLDFIVTFYRDLGIVSDISFDKIMAKINANKEYLASRWLVSAVKMNGNNYPTNTHKTDNDIINIFAQKKSIRID